MPEFAAALTRAGVDALWVSRPENVRYVTGFTSPEDGKALLTPQGAVLYTDARYTEQARLESSAEQFIARPPATLEHAAERVRGLRVGFEADALTVAALDDLRRFWPDATLVPTTGILETLRLIKTPDEIERIRQAQRIADEAFAAVRPLIRAGAVERDIEFAIEGEMRKRGARGWAHGFIVAGGERGALPHGHASDRVLQDGELVTVDIGAVYDGYVSDMTRTVRVGEVSAELRRIYHAVLEAEEAAIRAVRPGVRAADLDTLARDILTGHGLGEAFAHSLGHGVGLAVHEGPSLRGTSDDVLEPGMVITIEPGAYLPGLGGVRIEDLVLVTEDGYEVLSTSPKEPV
ncbi:M24 family metallopeptidase [Deinococcus maricopensis]|uniref:Peptidase M24 n=1 Tax=Deinococcus maricopensis (strain DSM 21211 / LMG 22137 / NRRL B-23946 / LB-34) TaxID=709986 RepID=E8U8S6_DEIML|nr:Xaa-Pro peptidase family protein [Deinococcus maricopensis]ADV67465.1 peptidase M24 [Deinococcus maricopensis DSM 21211]